MKKQSTTPKAPKVTLNPARSRAAAAPTRRAKAPKQEQGALPLAEPVAPPAEPLEATLAKVRGELLASREELQRTAGELAAAQAAGQLARGLHEELAAQLKEAQEQRDAARKARDKAEERERQAQAQERTADDEKSSIEHEALALAGDLAGQRFTTWKAASEWLRGEHDKRLRSHLAELRGAAVQGDDLERRLGRAERRVAELVETQHRDRDEMAGWRTRAELAEGQLVARTAPPRPKISPTSAADPVLAEKRREAARKAVETRRARLSGAASHAPAA